METIPTVTKNPFVRFPSSWRDAIGRPLRNSDITRYAREGRYGKDVQRVFLTKKVKVGDCLVMPKPCKCGSMATNYLRFSYLPSPGWYCRLCRLNHKAVYDKQQADEAALNAKLREARKAEREEKELRTTKLAALAAAYV